MKSKLTPQIQKEIGQNITLGMPLKFAAEAAGVAERTFYHWMEKGEKESKGQYHDFFIYCKNCQSKAVQLHLKLITKAASDGSWQASAWILERRHPEEFGRKDKLELDGKMKHSGKVEFHTLSDEELMEIIKNDS
jgi:hypothetical protein